MADLDKFFQKTMEIAEGLGKKRTAARAERRSIQDDMANKELGLRTQEAGSVNSLRAAQAEETRSRLDPGSFANVLKGKEFGLEETKATNMQSQFTQGLAQRQAEVAQTQSNFDLTRKDALDTARTGQSNFETNLELRQKELGIRDETAKARATVALQNADTKALTANAKLEADRKKALEDDLLSAEIY